MEASAFLIFLRSFIRLFFVVRLYIQAANTNSPVSPAGILFSLILHPVSVNVALPAARDIVKGSTAAWKADIVPLTAARRTSALVQDVSFEPPGAGESRSQDLAA